MNISRCGLLTALVALGAGCAGDDAIDDGDVLADFEPNGAASIDGGALDAALAVDGGAPSDGGATPVDARPDSGLPAGAYFAEVVANGSGCPAGTWQTTISSDGQHFRTTFTSFEVSLNDESEDPTYTKNCVIAIALRSPDGLSFSVKSARFTGYAFLEQGVTAVVRARYWFQGLPVPNTSRRLTLVGPYDRDFVYDDEVATADAVWSPCGLRRDLNVNATLQIVNSAPARSGYANIGNNSDAFSLELAWTRCKPLPAPSISKK